MSVPVGIPVAEAYPATHDDGPRALQTEENYPAGLVHALQESLESNPYRFWICDNSGSMGNHDGVVLHPSGFVSATRQKELEQTINNVATLSDALGARTDFHFLHARAGMQCVTLREKTDKSSWRLFGGIGCENSGNLNQVRGWVAKLTEPGYITPLTSRIYHLNRLLGPVAAELRQQGQHATVVIATDGTPDNPATFLEEMRQLQQLPVWVILRLVHLPARRRRLLERARQAAREAA